MSPPQQVCPEAQLQTILPFSHYILVHLRSARNVSGPPGPDLSSRASAQEDEKNQGEEGREGEVRVWACLGQRNGKLSNACCFLFLFLLRARGPGLTTGEDCRG